MKRLLLLTLILSSCGSTPPKKPTTIIGGDKDAHGCIASAGYVWSEVMQDCIRIWEAGTQLTLLSDTTKAGYAVFSSDSLCVELFLPNSKTHDILERRTNGDSWVWDIEDDGTVQLRKIGDVWQLMRGDKVIFEQKGEE